MWSAGEGNSRLTMTQSGIDRPDLAKVLVRNLGDIVASPEPGSLALAGLGCLAVVLFARRKRTPLNSI